MSQQTPLNYRPLTDVVLERIVDGIAQGVYQPDVLYSAHQLAEDLGVSRSPVREAVLRLAERGAVRIERNRGFRVKRPQPSDIEEIFEIRLGFEVSAAGRVATDGAAEVKTRIADEIAAMKRAAASGDEAGFVMHDRGLHDAILDGAGNQRMRSFIAQLREETHVLGANTMIRSRGLNDVCAEHVPIAEAIAAGNASAAATAMEAHLRHTLELLIGTLTD